MTLFIKKGFSAMLFTTLNFEDDPIFYDAIYEDLTITLIHDIKLPNSGIKSILVTDKNYETVVSTMNQHPFSLVSIFHSDQNI